MERNLYPEWLEKAKKSYKFRTLHEFYPDSDPTIYLIHLGAPVQSIEDEIEAGVVATCFINLDEKGNNLPLYSRLQKDGWEIGYQARVESSPNLFRGEVQYFKQFFDIYTYWCNRSYGVPMENSFFKMKPYIEDIIQPSKSAIQAVVVGNV